MGNVDPATAGRKLKAEIDAQVEAIQDSGARPAYIVLDMVSYQLWCTFAAGRKLDEIADPWGDGQLDLQPETEYRDIPIIAIPQLGRVVSVTVHMRDVWEDVDAFMRAVA